MEKGKFDILVFSTKKTRAPLLLVQTIKGGKKPSTIVRKGRQEAPTTTTSKKSSGTKRKKSEIASVNCIKLEEPKNDLTWKVGMDEEVVLGNNDIDDVRWLCSLTDSELDLLIGLKSLVKMRADKIGHDALTKKFDLHMLRTFSFIFIEHLKRQLQDLPVAPNFDCSLCNQNLSGSFAKMTVEDLYPFICSDWRKRMTDMFLEEMPPSHKQKASN